MVLSGNLNPPLVEKIVPEAVIAKLLVEVAVTKSVEVAVVPIEPEQFPAVQPAGGDASATRESKIENRRLKKVSVKTASAVAEVTVAIFFQVVFTVQIFMECLYSLQKSQGLP